jgi:hypothetical protein
MLEEENERRRSEKTQTKRPGCYMCMSEEDEKEEGDRNEEEKEEKK